MFGMGSESFRRKLCKIMHEQIIACIVTVVNATHHKTDRGIHDKKIINASLPKNFSSLFRVCKLQGFGALD